jgi:hypothetical protein
MALNWVTNSDGSVGVAGPGFPQLDYEPGIIFGAGNKLRSRGPFLDLYVEFKDALAHANRLIIVGYGFRDPHVNELIRWWIQLDRSGRLLRVSRFDDHVHPDFQDDDWALDGSRVKLQFIDGRACEEMEALVRPTSILESPVHPSVVAEVVTAQGGEAVGAVPAEVPTTSAEVEHLLEDRAPGWALVYFAYQLGVERDSADDVYQGYLRREANASRGAVSLPQVGELCRTALDELSSFVTQLEEALDPAKQSLALGEPGNPERPGDPDEVVEMARRLNKTYIDLMTWASSVRGVEIPSQGTEVVELLARYADSPVLSYRNFVDALLVEVAELPRAQIDGRPLRVDLGIKLEVPEYLSAAFKGAIGRLTRAFMG